MKKFYMVYAESGNSPTKKHETEREALEEAQRLCDLEQRNVFVLRASWVCVPEVVISTRRIRP